jgi:hypothetical protein
VIKTKPVRFSAQLFFKIEPGKRAAVEQLAKMEGLSLGEAARALIDEALKARGVEF